MTKDNWLLNAFSDAVAGKMCVSLRCTTCGAIPFQKLIISELSRNFEAQLEFENTSVNLLWRSLHSLRNVKAFISQLSGFTERDVNQYINPLRFLLAQLLAIKNTKLIDFVISELNGKPVGALIQELLEHKEKRRLFRESEKIRNDPELARMRREQKKTERAIAIQKIRGD